MVTTRSMAKATKKSDIGIALSHRVAGRESKKPGKGYLRIKEDAYSIFAIKDYYKLYFVTHPRPSGGAMPDEAIRGAKLEWLNMSDSDKEEWIQYGNKMKAEGTNMFHFHCECTATYPRI